MKISKVETLLLQIPYDIGGGPRAIAGQPAAGLNILLVRIETDEGLVGWGESFGHAVAPATKVVIDTMIAPRLIGLDPTKIDAIMLDLAKGLHLFGRNGPVVYALSGVDIALWDIVGKRANMPLYQLLGGGFRDELRVYASLLRYGDAETLAANVEPGRRLGLPLIKLHEIEPDLVGIARDGDGPHPRLMVDTNCPWTVPEALGKWQAPCRLTMSPGWKSPSGGRKTITASPRSGARHHPHRGRRECRRPA